MRPPRKTRMRVDRFRTSGISLEMRIDGVAGGGELVDEGVDLGLGADVDAARRLVEDQDRAARRQPLRQHDLLLVAAGERRRRRVEAAAPSASAARSTAAPPSRSTGRLMNPSRASRGRIDSVAFSSTFIDSTSPCRLRSSGTRPMPAAIARGAPSMTQRLAADEDAAGRVRIEAEDRLRHFRAAGADQPGEAEDLAGAHREGHVAEAGGARQALDAQRLVAGLACRRATGSTRRAAGRSSSRPACRASSDDGRHASRRAGRRAAR